MASREEDFGISLFNGRTSDMVQVEATFLWPKGFCEAVDFFVLERSVAPGAHRARHPIPGSEVGIRRWNDRGRRMYSSQPAVTRLPQGGVA